MPTKKKPVRLPSKLSALLRLAVKDAKAVSRRKAYRLEMGSWHRPEPDGPCLVCMAGATMANTLKVDPRCMIEPQELDESTRNKLYAIDSARAGAFQSALWELHQRRPPVSKRETLRRIGSEVYAKHKSADGRAPWSVYLAAADELEKAGL